VHIASNDFGKRKSDFFRDIAACVLMSFKFNLLQALLTVSHHFESGICSAIENDDFFC